MTNRNRRHELFVDAKLQGALLTRIVAYWFLGVFVIFLLIGFQVFLAGNGKPIVVNLQQSLAHFEPTLIAALGILPVILMDCLCVTSKFAGPLSRIRRQMRKMADGELVEPVQIRKKDFCQELSREFNRVIERVQKPRGDQSWQGKEERGVAHQEPATVG